MECISSQFRQGGIIILQQLKTWARSLKKDVITLYLVLKHPKTPILAKVVAAIVVGYALSPIDLIPDFIPIFGYLDDLILLPLGIMLAVSLIPPQILQTCRHEAETIMLSNLPHSRIAAGIIIILWLSLIIISGGLIYKTMK